MSVVIRKISEKDKEAVAALLTKHWQSAIMAVHGEAYDMSQLPGFMAVESGRIVGLATYIETAGSSIEIISLNSFSENRGIGTKLLSAIIQLATEKEAGRLFLTTTNDNMKALDFYQKKGFSISHFYPFAVRKARKIKPGIPLKGDNGIPIEHEIELDYRF